MNALARLKGLLWTLAVFGVVAIVARLAGGLGAVTDLSDAMPWGMWKILNMVAGVALATGGFVLAATVYVFGFKKYQPVVKPAVVIAMLGYGSSCFALFLDIGLPHRIWMPIFFWNGHSFLFEIAWCVMLYFTVTLLEVSPMVLETYRFGRVAHWLHKVSLPVVIAGITFSTLHHTSLGSLFLAMPARLNPLWFTPALPVLFFLSAIGGGIMTVVLVSIGYSHFYRRSVDTRVLLGLARGSAVILCIYLIVKLVDLAVRGQLGLLVSGQWESGFFWAELLLGALIPIGLVAFAHKRNSLPILVAAAALAVVGLVLNRLNVGITGLVRKADVSYFPSLAEVSLSLGLFAMAGLAFLFMVENFPVFEGTPARQWVGPIDEAEFRGGPGRSWTCHGTMIGPARVMLVITLAFPLAVGLFARDALHGIPLVKEPVHVPLGMDAARTVLEIDGNRNGIGVLFKHQLHQEKWGGKDSCRKCHHLDLPGNASPSCSLCHTDIRQPTSIFNHELHVAVLRDKWSCMKCHAEGQPKTLASSKACCECHAQDMRMEPPPAGPRDFHARGYLDAMHGLCIPCHAEQDNKTGKLKTAQCAFCHQEHRAPRALAQQRTNGREQP